MSAIETHAAPDVVWPAAIDSKWERERAAFLKLLPALLQHQRGKYVAVHEGQVVDSGDDEIALALRAYDQFGYVPIFVGLVTDDPRSVMRMLSPRLYRRRGRRRSPTVTGSSCKSTSELVAGDD